jgi:hypothetical protein
LYDPCLFVVGVLSCAKYRIALRTFTPPPYAIAPPLRAGVYDERF